MVILLACGPGVVVVNCLGHVVFLGRAPRTKETLPYFCEWCRVTRHPLVFRRLTGCQRTPGKWGVTVTRFFWDYCLNSQVYNYGKRVMIRLFRTVIKRFIFIF